MPRRKRKEEQFIDILFQLTGVIWQVGAVVTFCFIILAQFAFNYVTGFIANSEGSLLLAPIVETYGWLLYSLPITLFGFALLFGLRSLNAFTQERFF